MDGFVCLFSLGWLLATIMVLYLVAPSGCFGWVSLLCRIGIFVVWSSLVLWVSMQPPCHCGRMGTQHGDVQTVFKCLWTHLKKMGKFCNFHFFSFLPYFDGMLSFLGGRGFGQFITVYHIGGEGSLKGPKNYHIIYAQPLTL